MGPNWGKTSLDIEKVVIDPELLKAEDVGVLMGLNEFVCYSLR